MAGRVVLLQGMNQLDRQLFIRLAGTLAAACQRMVGLGVPAHETKPYFDMLLVLQERLRSQGPLLPIHILGADGPRCGDKSAVRDHHTLTNNPLACDCLACLRKAATEPWLPTSGGDLVN